MDGSLFVLSGPSGVGKGTVKNIVLRECTDVVESVSATTRKPRVGEIDGVSYYFKTDAEFKNMIANDEFLEYFENFKHSYGTPKAFVEQTVKSGKNVLLEIDVKGALTVKSKKPSAVLIMLVPPTMSGLKQRLIGRNTETAEEIQTRFDLAEWELGQYDKFDYIVVNDDLNVTCKNVIDIIDGKVEKQSDNKSVIEQILRG